MQNKRVSGDILTDTLRAALVKALESGDTLLGISRETGIDRASMGRFIKMRNSLRLDIASRLAEYLGLELRPVGKRRR